MPHSLGSIQHNILQPQTVWPCRIPALLSTSGLWGSLASWGGRLTRASRQCPYTGTRATANVAGRTAWFCTAPLAPHTGIGATHVSTVLNVTLHVIASWDTAYDTGLQTTCLDHRCHRTMSHPHGWFIHYTGVRGFLFLLLGCPGWGRLCGGQPSESAEAGRNAAGYHQLRTENPAEGRDVSRQVGWISVFLWQMKWSPMRKLRRPMGTCSTCSAQNQTDNGFHSRGRASAHAADAVAMHACIRPGNCFAFGDC